MAISRMNMERQLRAGGGIMTLEEPRQGYFLGKIVRKAKKAVKKVVKSPLGKLALGAAAANFAPMLFGKPTLLKSFGSSGGLGGLLSKIRSGEGFLGQIGNVFRQGGDKDNPFSIFRLAGGAAGLGALAAPFLMGDEEEVDPGVDVSGIQPMVSNIRQQARDFYKNPASRADSGLYFMPQQQFVQPSFFAAGGGLADIPRGGYNEGKSVLSKEQMTMIKQMKDKGSDIDTISSITGVSLEDVNKFLTSLNQQAEGGLADIPREEFESGERVSGILKLLSRLTPFGAAKELASNMDIDDLKKLSMITPAGAGKKAAEGLANMDTNLLRRLSMFTPVGAGRELAKKFAMKDGGMIDMGGLEKDYREGGFVPIGAEERADDVPARLSKNEFVFTADAVRNAGGGDIDKGAEVMQNMMDNLEAGGMISEESQGKENPAQAMFDQAQMLEGRLE